MLETEIFDRKQVEALVVVAQLAQKEAEDEVKQAADFADAVVKILADSKIMSQKLYSELVVLKEELIIAVEGVCVYATVCVCANVERVTRTRPRAKEREKNRGLEQNLREQRETARAKDFIRTYAHTHFSFSLCAHVAFCPSHFLLLSSSHPDAQTNAHLRTCTC